MADIQEQLREAQARVKALAARRDQLIREAGIEEQKLEQAYESLRQLGVGNPENLTEDGLKKLAEETERRLATEMDNLMGILAKGESLIKEYDQRQGV